MSVIYKIYKATYSLLLQMLVKIVEPKDYEEIHTQEEHRLLE